MIKAIISDLGNVLLHFDHMRPCKRLSERSGIPADFIYDKVFQSGLEKEYDLVRISSKKFGQSIINLFDINVPLDEIQQYWQEIFWPVPGMEELLRSLKDRYTLILLSNTNEWHFTYCYNTYSFLGFFDYHALSYKLGCRKPDPVIFDKAAKMAGADFENCLFIDDIQEYVDASSSLGIKGIRFQSCEQLTSELKSLGI